MSLGQRAHRRRRSQIPTAAIATNSSIEQHNALTTLPR
jgi:hypothetical protein